MVCMLNGPDDPGYQQAVEEMTESILKASEETDWQKKEKRHKRGRFPALARGISYGKGQHEPMRLVGDRQPMMEELFDKSCFKRVAGFQNGELSRPLMSAFRVRTTRSCLCNLVPQELCRACTTQCPTGCKTTSPAKKFQKQCIPLHDSQLRPFYLDTHSYRCKKRCPSSLRYNYRRKVRLQTERTPHPLGL